MTWADHLWSQISKREASTIGVSAAMLAFRQAGFTIFEAPGTRTPTRFAVARNKGTMYDVRVRTCRPPGGNYTFLTKEELTLSSTVLVVLVLLHDGAAPDLYLIQSCAWHAPTSLLVDRDYEGLASAPEWGISLSGKSMELLDALRFASSVQKL